MAVEPSNFYTPAALAARLGVKVETIWKYRTRGDIPPPDFHIGRTPCWRHDTIDAWWQTRRGQGWRKGMTA